MQGLIERGWSRGILLCLVLLMTSACSMQKPDSPFDLSKSAEKSAKAWSESRQQLPIRKKEPVRIDYLTALTHIVSPEIFVYKEKRRLYVIQSGVLVRDYPVGLGSNPVGDKEADSDGRTPEGDFHICQKNPLASSNKALVLDYPDKEHAQAAFFAGILSPPEFKEILLAAERKAVPPWNTKLGGKIYIEPGGAHKDWTDGCIAIYNSDMDELFKIASVGTPVHIRP